MEITRRSLFGGLGAVALMGGLAACGGGTKPGGGEKAGSASVWMLTGGPTEAVLKDSIKAWNDAHADQQINLELFANDAYKEKIRTAVGSDQAPTLIYNWTGATLADYVTSKKVVDITESTKDLQSKLLPSVLGAGTIDGKVYAVPLNNTQPIVLYSNLPNLEKAGLDASPTTWDALMGSIDKLKTAGIATPIALAGQSLWPYLMWIQYLADRVGGSDMFSAIVAGDTSKWTDSSMVKAAGMISDLVKAGAFGTGYGSVNADSNADLALLHTGRAGMLLQGAWVFGTFLTDAPQFVKDKQLGFGKFPTVEGGKGDPKSTVGNIANFWSVSATATEADRKTATEYLNTAMFDDKYTQGIIDGGGVPVIKGAGDKLKSADNAEFLTFVYEMVQEAPHFQLSWDQALPSGQAQDLLNNLGQLFLGQISAEQFTETMSTSK
ncbi:MAG: extracellular solute-binding protein [Arachnia sp.]